MKENLPNKHQENTPSNGDHFRTVSGHEIRVTGLLGQSNTGLVFRASMSGHADSPEDVAVKMLCLSNREGRKVPTSFLKQQKKSMEAEGKILSKLSGHPNILQLVSSEQVALPDHSVHKQALGYLPILVTTIAEEGDLRQRMKAMSQSEKVRALVDVGDALTYAHDNNIVHGDVTVANVLFNKYRSVMADWGLADDITTLENPNYVPMIRGTLYAIAPERFSGQVTTSNDVYSMGVLMHTLLTGNVPFPDIAQNDIADYEEAHRLRPFPSLKSLGINAPDLQKVIAAASQKEPDKRPSMREVTDQLFTVYLAQENKKSGTVYRSQRPH